MTARNGLKPRQANRLAEKITDFNPTKNKEQIMTEKPLKKEEINRNKSGKAKLSDEEVYAIRKQYRLWNDDTSSPVNKYEILAARYKTTTATIGSALKGINAYKNV